MSFDLDPIVDDDTGGPLPATREDLEQKHGKKTLEEMADLNNSRNPATIDSRITEALRYARDRISDIIAITDPPLRIVKHVAVALASAWLNGFPSKTDPDGFQRQIANELEWAAGLLEVWREVPPGTVTPTAAITDGIKVVMPGRSRCG